jgi:hypothetical protein
VNAGEWTTLAGVALAFLGVTSSYLALWQSQRNLNRQTRIAREAVQPYVWVDVRLDDAQGSALDLVVGNSGPTLARNVKARIDPPLALTYGSRDITRVAEERLREGIPSIAPNVQVRWYLGIGSQMLADLEREYKHKVEVTADGPWGPVSPLSYVIDLGLVRESRDQPSGSLHQVKLAIDAVSKKISPLEPEPPQESE